MNTIFFINEMFGRACETIMFIEGERSAIRQIDPIGSGGNFVMFLFCDVKNQSLLGTFTLYVIKLLATNLIVLFM